ncbi:gamma-glutamyltransferase [Opitutaceae bacterium TAV5]|nr:gamma-glutamyltransferase [Opitutaceae bacterium TAV5]
MQRGYVHARALFFALVFLLAAVARPMAAPMPVQVAEGKHGMVAAGHPDATAAGLAMLQAGGNAIDAAAAVAFALGVTEPYGSGLGGKLMLVYREARSGKVYVVEALDAAPAGLDEKAFRATPLAQRQGGALSVGVPGLTAGVLAAHGRWGARPRVDVMAPAIRLAREGFEVRAAQVKFFRAQEAKLRANPEAAAFYLPDGRTPETGQKLRNEDLARTMEVIAARGADGFYRGPVAEKIVAALRAQGSAMRVEDFARYQARTVEPLAVRFHGVDIYSAPPPVSGGGVYLLTLAALGDERLPGKSVLEPAAMDRVMRLYLEADARGRAVLGDREDSRSRWQQLLAPAMLAEIRRQAAPKTRVALEPAAPETDEAMAAETTHFVVMDAEGNVVSATQSQSNHFGSGLVAPGTGVVLNNSLSNFNTTRGNPNEAMAGRRPRTTIAPTIFVKAGRPVAALGVPGGSRIPSAMVQVTLDYLAYGRPLDEAIGAPRFHPVTRRGGSAESRFETERETDYVVAEALRSRFGWRDGTEGTTESFGGFTAVELLPDGGKRGFADQRRSNTAMGY